MAVLDSKPTGPHFMTDSLSEHFVGPGDITSESLHVTISQEGEQMQESMQTPVQTP